MLLLRTNAFGGATNCTKPVVSTHRTRAHNYLLAPRSPSILLRHLQLWISGRCCRVSLSSLRKYAKVRLSSSPTDTIPWRDRYGTICPAYKHDLLCFSYHRPRNSMKIQAFEYAPLGLWIAS